MRVKQFSQLQSTYIRTLYREKAFLIREEPFTLHHGGTSHLYLNHNQFLSSFENLKLLVSLYVVKLQTERKKFALGAVDSVMSPILCGFISSNLCCDVIVIKEKKLEHGLENKIYGASKHEVILIDDVTSTGTILINAKKALEQKRIRVRSAIVSACRDLTAIDNLKQNNLKAHYIATYEEIIRILWKNLRLKEQKIIRNEVKDKGYQWKFAQ